MKNLNAPSLPEQCVGNALQLCDATTGHSVKNVAFCDTPERAEEIIQSIFERNKLVAASVEALGNLAADGRQNCIAAKRLRDCLGEIGELHGNEYTQVTAEAESVSLNYAIRLALAFARVQSSIDWGDWSHADAVANKAQQYGVQPKDLEACIAAKKVSAKK